MEIPLGRSSAGHELDSPDETLVAGLDGVAAVGETGIVSKLDGLGEEEGNSLIVDHIVWVVASGLDAVRQLGNGVDLAASAAHVDAGWPGAHNLLILAEPEGLGKDLNEVAVGSEGGMSLGVVGDLRVPGGPAGVLVDGVLEGCQGVLALLRGPEGVDLVADFVLCGVSRVIGGWIWGELP